MFSLKEVLGVIKKGMFKPESFCDIVTILKTHTKPSIVNDGKGLLVQMVQHALHRSH